MTDVTYLPSWHQDIYLIEVGIPGPAGTGFTATEASVVRTDLNTLLARPNISTLESLTNVPDTGSVDGQTIVKSAGTWVYGNPNSSLTSVFDTWSGTPAVTNTTMITTGPGIKVEELTATGNKRAHMSLQFAGTGVATTAARTDHSHAAEVPLEIMLPYQGVLSTGYLTLTTAGITGLTAAETYDVEVTVLFDVITAGTTSKIVPRIGLGGGTLEGHQVEFRGYGKHVTAMAHQVGVTGVTSYPLLVRVFYVSGGAVEIGEGQIRAVARPRR